MKRFLTAASALILLAGSAVTASAQNYGQHDNRPAAHGAMNGPSNNNNNNNNRFHNPAPSHANWRKGGRIERNDWNRGQKVDYRSHHLSRPQRGYEWRQVDGNYVLAAAATGLIASIILSSH